MLQNTRVESGRVPHGYNRRKTDNRAKDARLTREYYLQS
ncbi:hypothetical protein SAMN05216593_101424 [Pseudomonas asturiensis]|uniref:Uncharacterized protein n=1 Tax=Pseudomonas asturiensis TaxID=1190415 RepID=A0A1M7JLU0_9PSED|nr:hypothetical protein SAMN05216593_101424 [Pseudomonas asturiensis]